MTLLNKKQYATFAAPRPGQSGLNWLLNRAAVDIPLAGAGIGQAIKGNLNLGKLAKYRRGRLDQLDEAQNVMNRVTRNTPRIDKSQISGAVGYPTKPYNPAVIPHRNRMFDDSFLEITGKDVRY